MKKWSELTDQELGYRVMRIAAVLLAILLLGQLGDPAAPRRKLESRKMEWKQQKWQELGLTEQEARERVLIEQEARRLQEASKQIEDLKRR